MVHEASGLFSAPRRARGVPRTGRLRIRAGPASALPPPCALAGGALPLEEVPAGRGGLGAWSPEQVGGRRDFWVRREVEGSLPVGLQHVGELVPRSPPSSPRGDLGTSISSDS